MNSPLKSKMLPISLCWAYAPLPQICVGFLRVHVLSVQISMKEEGKEYLILDLGAERLDFLVICKRYIMLLSQSSISAICTISDKENFLGVQKSYSQRRLSTLHDSVLWSASMSPSNLLSTQRTVMHAET